MTYEHIPPLASGNSGPVRFWHPGLFMKGIAAPQKRPNGVGMWSLCQACNSRTGGKYVPHFTRFAERARHYLETTPSGLELVLPYTLRPLAVAKQLATMALAVNLSESMDSPLGRSLRRLVNSDTLSGKPEGAQFYVYLMDGGEWRLCQYAAHLSAAGVKNVLCWAEIAIPPLGVVALSDGDSEREFARRVGLINVTSFFEAPRAHERTIFARLPRLRPVGAVSLDYQGIAENAMYPSRRARSSE